MSGLSRFKRDLISCLSGIEPSGKGDTMLEWENRTARRKLRLITFPGCNSVQRELHHLDKPEFVEIGTGHCSIATDPPIPLGHGKLSVQSCRTWSTRPPSIGECARLAKWLRGKLSGDEVMG